MKEINIEPKLKKIYDFLKNNREYNKALQTRYYESILLSCNKPEEKVVSLLYHIANTQSRPKIDSLAEFYKPIIGNNISALRSFEGFMDRLSESQNVVLNYENLYECLKKKSGYGEKTAALFTKTIFHIHSAEYPDHLRIWDDAPNLTDGDRLYLPVDAVIFFIFYKLTGKNLTFKKINDIISQNYRGREVEVWDDLWFWGFITQKNKRKDGNSIRELEWNENKYWALWETDKSQKTISEIQSRSLAFIKLLESLLN